MAATKQFQDESTCLIFYGGTFYGSWSVIDSDTVYRSEDMQQRLETFEPSKAIHPWQGQFAA
jgi:hypothetical protein